MTRKLLENVEPTVDISKYLYCKCIRYCGQKWWAVGRQICQVVGGQISQQPADKCRSIVKKAGEAISTPVSLNLSFVSIPIKIAKTFELFHPSPRIAVHLFYVI